jgi:hypothetical protein
LVESHVQGGAESEHEWMIGLELVARHFEEFGSDAQKG